MNKQKIKVSLLVVVLLAIAFFWGGNKEVVPLSAEEMGKDGGIVGGIVEDSSTDDEIESPNKEDNEDAEDNEEDNEKEDNEEEEVEEPEDEVVKKEKNTSKEKDKNKEKNLAAKEEVTKKETNNKKSKEKKAVKDKKDKEAKQEIIDKDKGNKGQQDQYLTDPTPEGKPKPVEPDDVGKNKDKKMTATLSVTAKSILNNMDIFNMDKIDVLPKNGVVYATKTITFYEGESVFDVLLREMKANKIHMEFSTTPAYNSHYIEGINNLYEFDCGELSGWMYRVNGWFPNYGVSRYQLKDGDTIELMYTCDLGRDIGGGKALNGEGQ